MKVVLVKFMAKIIYFTCKWFMLSTLQMAFPEINKTILLPLVTVGQWGQPQKNKKYWIFRVTCYTLSNFYGSVLPSADKKSVIHVLWNMWTENCDRTAKYAINLIVIFFLFFFFSVKTLVVKNYAFLHINM